MVQIHLMEAQINPGATLASHFEDRQQEIVEFIRWLVEQESMSREAEATAAIAENLGDRLARFGAAVELFRHPKFGATLRARFGNGAAEEKQLLVVGHLDTVWPLGTLSLRPFRIEDGRAYGPGIFDMKAGVTLAVFAMRALGEMGRAARRPVTLLMTCDEETGSHFSRDLIEEEARRARAALVLEPPIPGGAIKTARKGVGEFELIVRGRPAHAGNDPRAGISAVTELAHQVLAINAMSSYEQGTTLNVGVVKGGVLANVIAAEARASIDMRYQTVEEGERIIAAMKSLKPTLDGARLEVRGGINRPPLVRTAEAGALFEHARRLAAEIGFELREGAVGGGSDGNFIGALGVPVLDGLGVDGAGAHAEHEHIVLSDIPRRAALLTRLIETI
ncbi:MAG TPA: M20 family metallopeptidase [Blastocatellia bacterium]|nr:M20 family metallopeptidase [Blastocatellia bacterium]